MRGAHRLICMFLTVVLVFGLVPISAKADAGCCETADLDYGLIPEGYSNKLVFQLEPALFSNKFYVYSRLDRKTVAMGYNSNAELRYLSNGTLRLAAYWDQHLYINDYSADFSLLESRDIPVALPMWGGVYLGEDVSFVFCGQRSDDTPDGGEVYRITKYDGDFNEVSVLSLTAKESATATPFGYGNAVMGLRDNILTIFTNRAHKSGYNPLPFAMQIDIDKMDGPDPAAAVQFSYAGYQVFDYNGKTAYRNVLGFDGDQPIYAVADDAYPGGIYISAGENLSYLQPDTALGDNEYRDVPISTDATNMAVSSSHYLVASTFENYGVNNIYLAIQNKETGEISGRFLTNATAFNSEINENPWIVDLGNDRFAVLWERIELGMMNVCSVLLDASGTPMGQVETWRDCSLSLSIPICADGNILWVEAEAGEMKLHQLSNLDASGYQEIGSGIVEGDTVWDGTSDTSWYQAEKTVFTISTAEQLAGLAALVNGGNDFAGKTVLLANDLFMNSSPYGHVENNQWIPIGASEDGSVEFNGTFDGQCHGIYNMVVPSDGPAGGVFGTVGTEGTVKCLTVAQGWFDSSASVADTNYGNILFCIAKSHVTAPSDERRGGVCTYNYGTIYGCQNHGFIEQSPVCGGIVFRNAQGGTISQCTNKGLLYTYLNTFTNNGTAGIAYENYGWIYNCYNLGAAENGSRRTAGIVGYTNGYSGCGQVYNCYSLSGYKLKCPIFVSKGNTAKVENCFGNTEPGSEWYEEFCKPEFLTALDTQLGPKGSAWCPDTLGINNGLPITVAEYNYHMGCYKIQPELWAVSPEKTVTLSEVSTIDLSGVEYYYSDAALEITSDNPDVAEVIDGKIHVYRPGTANILFHLDETEHSTALDYTTVLTVLPGENAYTPGDITGDEKVNNRDAARLMQYLAGWDVEFVEAALDVNGDGKVNNRDAARLMQYLAGWDVEIH